LREDADFAADRLRGVAEAAAFRAFGAAARFVPPVFAPFFAAGRVVLPGVPTVGPGAGSIAGDGFAADSAKDPVGGVSMNPPRTGPV